LRCLQAGSREPAGEALGVLRPQRPPADVFAERILRVDLLELSPYPAGLVDLPEVAKRGGKRDAGKIRLGDEHNPLSQQSRRCFIFPGQHVCRAEAAEKLFIECRIKTHRLLDRLNRFQWLSQIHANTAKEVM